MRRSWITWLWAAIGALGLNVALFAAMPHLLQPVSADRVFDQVVSHVNVIRIKRPEIPVKHRTEKPPEPPPKRSVPDKVVKQPIIAKLALPFEVNPRLPAAPGTLNLPALMPAKLDVSAFADVFSAGELDAPLTVLARIPPVYPLQAKKRGIEGWVKVHFLVNEDGQVEKVTVQESNPQGLFDQSVLRCVSAWRFKPGTVEGMPVKAWAETTVRFELE